MTSGADGAPSAAVCAVSDPAESAESALSWGAGFAKSGACGAGAECNASTLMVAPLSGTKVQVVRGATLVVSLDISSSFFIIPIAEKDRYKTAFWVNDLSYQFRVLVMGLKSSPWHLKAFIESVFSPSAYSEFIKQLSKN